MSKIFEQLRSLESGRRVGNLDYNWIAAMHYVSVACFAFAAPACIASAWRLAGALLSLAVALRFLAHDLVAGTAP